MGEVRAPLWWNRSRSFSSNDARFQTLEKCERDETQGPDARDRAEEVHLSKKDLLGSGEGCVLYISSYRRRQACATCT